MHIAIITAGGAGMFCGSCMHDNTLARALMAAGHEVSLLPTYTPVRVDEASASMDRVFLGGINLYLEAHVPGYRFLPRWLTRWLDRPGLIRRATAGSVSSNAAELGEMTVSLLKGAEGPHRKPLAELAEFLGRELRPDVVCFTNALLAGLLPALKREFNGPIVCFLQGDDVFLKDLVPPYHQSVVELLRKQCQSFDGYIANAAFYKDVMSPILGIDPQRVEIVPLGIDLEGHTGLPRQQPHAPFTVGYFARICPEKGLHNLVAAFRTLHARHPNTRLLAGGYLGVRDHEYFEKLKQSAADLGTAFEYAGSPPDHDSKVQFFSQIDVMCTPTDYKEPKGLYVLEAWANGVPVVLPAHGSFPDLIGETQGGLLVPPGDTAGTAAALETLLLDNTRRQALAAKGHAAVRENLSAAAMARRTVTAIERIRDRR